WTAAGRPATPRPPCVTSSGRCSTAASSAPTTEPPLSRKRQTAQGTSAMSHAPILSRRDWLTLAASGALAPCLSGWLERLAHAAGPLPARKRSCILLWMSGGPSTIDLWDLKPGHANGGPFKEIQTSAPGLKISEHLPKVAKFADKMAVVRSMTTKEG